MASQEQRKEPEEWQSSSKQVTARLRLALKECKYTDCIFHVVQESEKEVFKAHKLILSNASCVFEAMFYGPLESDKPIVIEDISSRGFSVLLDYIYTGEFNENVTVELVAEAWYAAEKYQMKFLCTDCENFLFGKTNGTNVGTVLNQARLLRHEEMEGFCWNIIESNTDFDKTDLFDALSMGLLLELLDKDELSTKNELQLFKGIERRCRLECEAQNLEVTPENMQAFGRDLVHKVRFLNTEVRTLVLEAASAESLTDKEKLAVFANVANVEKLPDVVPMPAGFSLRVENRISLFPEKRLEGIQCGNYAFVQTVMAPHDDIFDCHPYKEFTLTINNPHYAFCIDKISFHDSKATKKLVISDSDNKIIFAGRAHGNELVFEKEYYFRYDELYNLKVTLSNATSCKAYRRPVLASWGVSHFNYHNGKTYSMPLSSSSDFILIKFLSIAAAEDVH